VIRLSVEHAGGGCDGERRDRDPGLRETQLRIGGEVADHRDDGVIRHGCSCAPGLWGDAGRTPVPGGPRWWPMLLRGSDEGASWQAAGRSEEHTSELQSRFDLVCRLLLE